MRMKKRYQFTVWLSWTIILLYTSIAILTRANLISTNWDESIGLSFQSPCWSTNTQDVAIDDSYNTKISLNTTKIDPTDPLAPTLKKLIPEISHSSQKFANKASCSVLGFDRWGRDIMQKMIQGTSTSLTVGIGSALLAVSLGTLFGAIAGYYAHSPIDKCLNGLYNIFTSIPSLLLILAIAALLEKRGMLPIILILGFTGWTGAFRLLRAEYIKHRSRDYVLAAELLGASPYRIMAKHILPNTVHLVGVQTAILSIGFMKSEVILSFLGLGVDVNEVSWGTLLSESQTELLIGFPWQLIAATLAMSILSIALSRLADEYTDPISHFHP